jgi:hypothetical protein
MRSSTISVPHADLILTDTRIIMINDMISVSRKYMVNLDAKTRNTHQYLLSVLVWLHVNTSLPTPGS